jgi:hypothetical protein
MSLIGCIDTLWDTYISGWAADHIDHEKAIQVDVIVNSLVVATLPCVNFREDLRAAGIGDGCKSFKFDPSAYLLAGRNNLEVHYAGTGEVVHNGRHHWVKRRTGGISEWEATFLAALEAHYEFRPEHHVCGIGVGAAELERVLVEAGVPFRKFTSMEVPSDPAAIQLPEKADLVVSWAWSTPSPEAVRTLKQLVQDHMNKPGFLAIGFYETAELSGREGRQVFRECGAPEVKLESIPPPPDGLPRMFAFAKTPAAEAAPLLAHIHLPKCAGTSVRVLLETYFGPRHLSLYVDDTYFVYSDGVIRNYLLQNSGIQAISSHHVRVFPRWLAGREMFYVTFLRDPIQQFVSYMTHIKKYYSTLTSASLLEAVPPDAPQLTLREFARWLLTNDRDIPFRENHNVNFFARHSSPAATDRLAAAKAALGEFLFVGIAERMEESISRLRARAQETGLEFPPGSVPFENTSAEYRDDLSWINPDDEVGALLMRSVDEDRQLYEWAWERLTHVGC